MPSAFLHGPLVFNEHRVFTGTGTITMLNETVLEVNKAVGAASAVTLPASPSRGRTVWIKDANGDAATNPITITPAAGNVDDNATVVINSDWGCYCLQYNGTQWSVLSESTSEGVGLANDELLTLGTGNDWAVVDRSTILATNTALTGVIVGTPVTPAVAADSLIIGGVTASGDFLLAINRGGNSENYIWADSSAGDLTLYAPAGEIMLNPTTDVQINNGTGLLIGATAQVTISDGDGATNLIPELQVLGTAAADGSLLVAAFNTTNTRAVSPHIALVKGAAATQVATTAVADNEVVGSIIAYGSDSADFETPVAAIEFVVDDVGAPGAGAIGGSLEFYTTADGGEVLTLSFTVNNDQNIFVANNNGVVIGHTAQIAAGAVTSELQLHGTAPADSTMLLAAWSADAVAPRLHFAKSRSATVGTFSIITTGDNLGEILAYGDDGVDFNSNSNASCAIIFDSAGTIGADRIAGVIRLQTATDAAPSVLTTALTIDQTQTVTAAAGLIAKSATAAAIVTTRTLTAADSGGVFSVAKGSAYAITLPTPAQGIIFSFLVLDTGANAVTISDGAAHLFGTVSVNNVSTAMTGTTLSLASAGSVGDWVTFQGIDSTHYLVTGACIAAADITIA